MEQIDRMLIFELSSNCRASFKALAEKYGMSSEEINARVTKLLQQRVIIKFTVAPSSQVFGEDAFILFRSSSQLASERVTLLGIQSCVEYISMSQDHTEGFAYVHFRSEEELEDLLNHFGEFHRGFTDLRIYRLQRPTSAVEARPELRGTHVFEKVDWLLLSHLREQGRLPIEELAKRTKFSQELIADRLYFLREAGLIEQTIYINLSRSHKESHTIFFLELDLLTQLLQQELTRELSERFKGSFWRSWKVEDQQILVLSFLCSSYSEIDKIQSFLSDLAGVKSIESIMGGVTYHFPDFRDEIIEEKRSHGWFSPEQWL